MLRTRLWMGALLIALVAAVLLIDQRLEPWYPFLFVLVLMLSVVACSELIHLVRMDGPATWLAYGGVIGILVANWAPHVFAPTESTTGGDPWPWVIGVFGAVVLLAFLVEMSRFRGPSGAISRIALVVWIAAYLGLLASFLVQLRWLPGPSRATSALALAIFVPKCGDIGAYFTGRLIGRHRMAPVLSPKKTWEGAAGGLAASVLAAVGIDRIGHVVRGVGQAAVLGLAVGVAGMLGDLAESLIKRDCEQKDASRVVPGFGGVLDVVDAILFAAPVAYGGVIWLS
jgi:phosphatidate cytidylyltransferase